MSQELLLALAIGAGGMVLVGYSVFIWTKARRSKRWPTVAGTVLTTDVGSSTYRGTTAYVAHVAYEYSVGGHTYRSMQRGVGVPVGQSEASAEAVSARYNPGATVWVFYDPANPADAVIEHVAPAALPWFLFGVGVIALAIWGLQAST